MTYRLPVRSTTACSSGGCDATVSYDDADPVGRTHALAGWSLGPATAVCPSHPVAATCLLAAG